MSRAEMEKVLAKHGLVIRPAEDAVKSVEEVTQVDRDFELDVEAGPTGLNVVMRAHTEVTVGERKYKTVSQLVVPAAEWWNAVRLLSQEWRLAEQEVPNMDTSMIASV